MQNVVNNTYMELENEHEGWHRTAHQIAERLFTENMTNVEKKHHQNHENFTKKRFGNTASTVLF